MLEYFSTSFIMHELFSATWWCKIYHFHSSASDFKIRALLSKNHDLTKILLWDVVYNDDLCKYLNLPYNSKENDDFKTAKIFQIYEDLSNTRDIVYIGSTCDTKKCMSNFKIKSKSV